MKEVYEVGPKNLQLFWAFVGAPVWSDVFLICGMKLDEYWTKFFPSTFLNFSPVWFFIILLAESSNWRKYLHKFK